MLTYWDEDGEGKNEGKGRREVNRVGGGEGRVGGGVGMWISR